jgi:hypothetical protein
MSCPVDDVHEWGPQMRATANSGPLDGEWLVTECLHCNTFSLVPVSGGSGIELVLAALAEAGCDPRPLGAAS